MRRLIIFDWAIKCLLRSKANFDVLEGFLSELLKDMMAVLSMPLKKYPCHIVQ